MLGSVASASSHLLIASNHRHAVGVSRFVAVRRVPFAVRFSLLVAVFAAIVTVVRADLLPVEPVSSDEDETILKEFMICRHCGSDIALSNFLVNTLSPAAKHWTHGRLYSTADVLVQDLVNPLGGRFRVVAVRKAQCAKTDNWHQSHTWFPGFAWKQCMCPKCAGHLGWMFEPFETANASQHFPTDGRGFYLLIVHNVLSESYVNSLIATDWDRSPALQKPIN